MKVSKSISVLVFLSSLFVSSIGTAQSQPILNTCQTFERQVAELHSKEVEDGQILILGNTNIQKTFRLLKGLPGCACPLERAGVFRSLIQSVKLSKNSKHSFQLRKLLRHWILKSQTGDSSVAETLMNLQLLLESATTGLVEVSATEMDELKLMMTQAENGNKPAELSQNIKAWVQRNWK